MIIICFTCLVLHRSIVLISRPYALIQQIFDLNLMCSFLFTQIFQNLFSVSCRFYMVFIIFLRFSPAKDSSFGVSQRKPQWSFLRRKIEFDISCWLLSDFIRTLLQPDRFTCYHRITIASIFCKRTSKKCLLSIWGISSNQFGLMILISSNSYEFCTLESVMCTKR